MSEQKRVCVSVIGEDFEAWADWTDMRACHDAIGFVRAHLDANPPRYRMYEPILIEVYPDAGLDIFRRYAGGAAPSAEGRP